MEQKTKKRRCPDQAFAEKYAEALSIYYEHVEVVKEYEMFYVVYF